MFPFTPGETLSGCPYLADCDIFGRVVETPAEIPPPARATSARIPNAPPLAPSCDGFIAEDCDCPAVCCCVVELAFL